MTTLIGIQGDGFALLAADSLMVSGQRPYAAAGMVKIKQCGDVYIGFAGYGVAIDMVEDWEPDTSSYHELCMSLKRHFMLRGYEHEPEAWEALALVNGKIVEISAIYDWLQDDDRIYGVGSGSHYAVGAIANMKRPWENAEKAIRAADAAIKISERYDINTGGEHQIVIQEESDVSNG